MRAVVNAMIRKDYKAILLSCVVSIYAFPVAATTYYVSSTLGRNSYNGQSPGAPFKTIQKAESVTQPGDTVFVMQGTYHEPWAGAFILNVTRSGTPAAWITYKAYPGQRPLLQYSNSWAAINIKANYIIIDGFEVAGNAQSITYSYAQSQQYNLSNSLTNGDGIDIGGSKKGAPVNHVIVVNNLVHDVSGGGINAQYADYVTIVENVVYNTSWWSPYGNSGISIHDPHDADTNIAYKNFVFQNAVYNNAEYIPCSCVQYQYISDGNGIIIDDNKNTQSNKQPYRGRTLVSGNLSFNNGGAGIQIFSSQHVDVLNNTAYMNEQSPDLNDGQIFAQVSSDVSIQSNILYGISGKNVITNQGNDNTVTDDYQIFWGSGDVTIPQGSGTGAHDTLADPLLVSPSSNNFQLETGSPAQGSGNLSYVQGVMSNVNSALSYQNWPSAYAAVIGAFIVNEETSIGPDRGAY